MQPKPIKATFTRRDRSSWVEFIPKLQTYCDFFEYERLDMRTLAAESADIAFAKTMGIAFEPLPEPPRHKHIAFDLKEAQELEHEIRAFYFERG